MTPNPNRRPAIPQRGSRRGRSTARLAAGAVCAALLASMLALPAAAQTADAFVAGAQAWTASDCTGDTPIVVGSDTAAQSDIYSAVTLAGVIDTDCVILAGPRNSAIPATQQQRLDVAAAGGYIVGGTAAVPAVKTAGRDMTRLAGANRWATAQLVGDLARTLNNDTGKAPATTLDHTLSAPGDVAQPGLHLNGAGPWTASDCTGDTPIIVGSDPAAQSDIYSAVTLAGIIDTDCVILAGARNSTIPNSQQQRLNTAAAGGYIIGGTAAVPAAKTAGRNMTRLAGTNRWTTAQLVGQHTTNNTTDTTTTAPAKFTPISAGGIHSCGVRSDGTATCWGYNSDGQADAPTGKFTSISAGGFHSCGLRSDGTATCWGANGQGRTDAPTGKFTSITAGWRHSCGLRSDGTATCWGNNDFGHADAPTGKFTSITAGGIHSCGLRSDGTATCWGDNDFGQADAPTGKFTSITAGGIHSCGVRSDGTATCWGNNSDGQADAPTGKFTSITAGSGHGCGLRSDGTATCWGDNDHGRADAPTGKFTSITAGDSHSCGLRSDGTATCWGNNDHGRADAPTGKFTSITAGNDQGRADAPMVDVVEYNVGDTIGGFPSASALAANASNFSGASVHARLSPTGGGGTVTVTFDHNGTVPYADTTYSCASAGGCAIVNGRVTKGTVKATTGAVAADQTAADLVVGTPTVSTNSPTAGDSFTLSATVRNQGNGPSASTTLRYYRSADANITAGDTAAGTDIVSRLDARQSGAESIRLTAPSTPGTYYYGACVDTVSDEPDTSNNCSTAVTVTVAADQTAADLVVGTPTVSTSSPTAGDSFTLSATVRNQGNGPSASTTLRYYRSADANITAGDTAAGTDIVSRLDARQSGAESIRLTAPSTPGTYYYGACVDSVARESDTQNNCSTAVTVTVAADATIPQTTGDCYVGLVVAVGERCTYPGSTNDFWVDSSGRGHFIFFTAGTGISARNTTINGVRYNFAASKQSDGTWIIEAAG